MPTPTGLPKAGERVAFSLSLPPDWKREWRYGTVVRRSGGGYWALYVRWDDSNRDVEMMVDAAYHLAQGNLKVIDAEEVS